MEQTLEFKLSPKPLMTPKLQKAIRILQMATPDLRELMEREYAENPALEIEYPQEALAETKEGGEEDKLAALAEYLDADERHYLPTREEREPIFTAPKGMTLADYLMTQVRFIFRNKNKLKLATFMVGSIDSRGYLTLTTEEIVEATGAAKTEVEGILKRLQELEPVGVAARNLAECLRLQAKSRGIYDGLVAALIDKYLREVAAAKLKQIAAAEGATLGEVQAAVDTLKTLNPKPGSSYGSENTVYVIPDVVWQETETGYQVVINDRYLPKLFLSPTLGQIKTADKTIKKYLHRQLENAAWLLKSIEQRRQTLRRVVENILAHQPKLAAKGLQTLEPLSMKEVAESLGLHESTVSRAVANKYLALPWGVVPLRQFFSASLASPGEEQYNAGQVKAAIREIIDGEDNQKPYSDQKIAALLAKRQLSVSRRTVVKYREQMGFPSSVKRRRY
ncbi:MAG: RNA polymerase factor sigma-54 [Selenomonadaceae bacterium]|nr:RNA polymerase factor sigma-54 [Selenomonadaceae bacterium]